MNAVLSSVSTVSEDTYETSGQEHKYCLGKPRKYTCFDPDNPNHDDPDFYPWSRLGVFF